MDNFFELKVAVPTKVTDIDETLEKAGEEEI